MAGALAETIRRCEAGILRFGRGFGEDAYPQRSVPEPKRSQKPKRPLPTVSAIALRAARKGSLRSATALLEMLLNWLTFNLMGYPFSATSKEILYYHH